MFYAIVAATLLGLILLSACALMQVGINVAVAKRIKALEDYCGPTTPGHWEADSDQEAQKEK